MKRKRLIEDEDFLQPCVKRDLLSHAIVRLKSVASALAIGVGQLLQGSSWGGLNCDYSVGDHVMAKYSDGEWYAATVAEDLGDVRFRLHWDDGDSQNRIKTAEEMMRLEDFAKCAKRALKRQKMADKEENRENFDKSKTQKGALEKVATAGSRSAAVYTFEPGVGIEHDAFHRR